MEAKINDRDKKRSGARTAGGITQRQEAFCLAFIETGNASEAYRRAYKPKRMSAKSVHEKASHILAEGKVQARVVTLRKEATRALGYKVEDAMRETHEALVIAKTKQNSQGMVAAIQLKSKLKGLIVEKQERGGPGDFADTTDEELIDAAREADAVIAAAQGRADSESTRSQGTKTQGSKPQALDVLPGRRAASA
jgi:hypothetical protein